MVSRQGRERESFAAAAADQRPAQECQLGPRKGKRSGKTVDCMTEGRSEADDIFEQERLSYRRAGRRCVTSLVQEAESLTADNLCTSRRRGQIMPHW